MAKHFQRGGDRRGRPQGGRHAGSALGPNGDRLWLHGVHPVLAALGNPDRTARRLLITSELAERLGPRLDGALAARNGQLKPEIVERRALDNLLREAVHQGIALEADPLPEAFLQDLMIKAESRPESLLVVLDQVTDPHNVGAVLRSAAVFGALAVIMQDRHAPESTGVLAKSASGALEAVPLVRVVNLARALDTLKEAGFWCLGLDAAAPTPIEAISPAAKRALVLGAEGAGLRRLVREACDEVARIDGPGPMTSLNVSNAAAVALYALSRGHRAP
jgi:23S rRNA (guanosine2251-2'-O)-methyltransferase